MNILDYFFDPIFRGPTIGTMLMCLSAALVGAIVLLRRQSLVGEALSHSTYPGVVLGAALAGVLFGESVSNTTMSIFILTGAAIFAFLGWCGIQFLERSLHIRSDAALCLILSLFFGIGVTFASDVQFAYSSLYMQIQMYLFGQAATMTDFHIALYSLLSLLVITIVVVFQRELELVTFDRQYAKTIGVRTFLVEAWITLLLILAIVIGIRSVGIVLMSAMLIAPAAAARQLATSFRSLLTLTALVAVLSAFLGNYLSIEIPALLDAGSLSLPTGPMIVLVATVLCLFALLFSPGRGVVLRLVRRLRFRHRCLCENILKTLWKLGARETHTKAEILQYQSLSKWHLTLILRQLQWEGWLSLSKGNIQLTHAGEQRGGHIVRLHRLWELYLVTCAGAGIERVHRNAEEMEHILTPEIEAELTRLLHNPQKDPHRQPIPPQELL